MFADISARLLLSFYVLSKEDGIIFCWNALFYASCIKKTKKIKKISEIYSQFAIGMLYCNSKKVNKLIMDVNKIVDVLYS